MNRKSNLTLRTGAVIVQKSKPRSVVIEWTPATPDLVSLRLQGTRQRFPVSAATLYTMAVQLHADRERAERRKARRLVK